MTSIRDIAARAGVSIGTVDRVLHHRGRVSLRTRQRVEKIIRQLHYRPNMYARNLSLSRTYRFAALIPRLSQDSEYWRLPARGITKAREELEAYRVTVRFFHFDRYSHESFGRAFGAATQWDPDGILVAPVLEDSGQGVLTRTGGRIPRVFIDSPLPGADAILTVTQNPYQSGLLAAHLMQAMVNGGKRTLAVVKVLPVDYHISERIRGFVDGIGARRASSVPVYEVDSRLGGAGFRRVVRRILRENEHLRGVFVSNAWTHAVARSCRLLAPGRQIRIAGYDLVRENLKLLESGAIDFLISQRPETQGYEGIYALYRHVVLRERVPGRIMVPLDILTRDNARYSLD
jgi:LacI family transcriptional regulator